jgi:oligoendopeptidase F
MFFAFAVFIAILWSNPSLADITPNPSEARSRVPEIYKWDASIIFKDESAYNSAIKSIEAGLAKISQRKNKLGTDTLLKSTLDEYVFLKKTMSKIGIYSELRLAEDKNVEKNQNIHRRAQKLANNFNSGTSFIKQALLNMKDAELDAMLSGGILNEYRGYIEALRRRKDRVLGEDAERILGLVGDNLFASTWPTSDNEMIFQAIMRDINFPKIKDEEGKEIQLSVQAYSKYRASKDRNVRKAAVETFLETLRKYQNIFAASLAAEVNRDVMFAKARNYDRAVEAYLDIDDIDTAVMDNLINTIHKNLKPLHRYIALRRKLLGIDKVHLYDLYTPIIKSVDTDVPYSEGGEMVVKSLASLGEEYTSVVARAVTPGSGWIDVYPNEGKESGAFSTSTWGIHPFIKLNYQNQMDDVSTLTHELGHTMHSYLNMNAQPFVDFGYSTFTAEIASTFNEKLLNDYLLEKYSENDDIRLYILGEMLESIRTTIYRQTLFAEFERKIHEFSEQGTPITAELLNKTYIGLVRKYYGPELAIGADDAVEWAFIPHFYYKYYVYTYATGLSSGIALAEMVQKEGDKARDRYFEMLRAPSNEPPLEILKKAGLDLTKPHVIESATNLMAKTITEIEKIIRKKGKN